MQVLIADVMHDNAPNAIRQLGVDVAYRPALTAVTLQDHLADADVLIVRSTHVTESAIEKAPRLKLIVRAGAGVNTIDVNAASEQGVYVANCPGQNASAVAELVIGLLLALDRQIVDAALDLRRGVWGKVRYGGGLGLHGRTLGIIGFGKTGQMVARAAKGLGMRVAVWSRSLTAQRAAIFDVDYCPTPEALARSSHAVSVHLAATSDTFHFISTPFFNALPPDAMFINTSRGEIVDTQALKTAVRTRGLRAGLDVYENEPPAGATRFLDAELANMVIGTPHIAASTVQAMAAVAQEATHVVAHFLATGVPANVVNAPAVVPFQPEMAWLND